MRAKHTIRRGMASHLVPTQERGNEKNVKRDPISDFGLSILQSAICNWFLRGD